MAITQGRRELNPEGLLEINRISSFPQALPNYLHVGHEVEFSQSRGSAKHGRGVLRTNSKGVCTLGPSEEGTEKGWTFCQSVNVHCQRSLGNITQIRDRGKENPIAPFYLSMTSYFIPRLSREFCISLLWSWDFTVLMRTTGEKEPWKMPGQTELIHIIKSCIQKEGAQGKGLRNGVGEGGAIYTLWQWGNMSGEDQEWRSIFRSVQTNRPTTALGDSLNH